MLAGLYYGAQRWVWRRFKPRTRGVKVMLFNNDGHLLLIRNTYGDSRAFVLPGGGVGAFEAPEMAARREVKEELGCGVTDVTLVDIYFSEREGKRDSVWLFSAFTDETPKPDQKEVAEASFYPVEYLPEGVSPATKRRVDEYRGAAERTSRW